MTATHILFVPWPHGESDQEEKAKAWAKFGNENKRLSTTGEARRFKKVVYRENVESENLKRAQTGQIYVMGHGAAGHASIESLAADGVALNAAHVAQRLIDSGLRPEFSGKIKCFSCHSSKKPDWATPSFAESFAAEMRNKGYRHCQYFGYNNFVFATYSDLLGDGEMHRFWALAAGVDKDGQTRYAAMGRAGAKRQLIQ